MRRILCGVSFLPGLGTEKIQIWDRILHYSCPGLQHVFTLRFVTLTPLNVIMVITDRADTYRQC